MFLSHSLLRAADDVTFRQPPLIPAGRTLTLAECLALARENQATIRVSQAQIQAAAGAVRQARAGLLPEPSVSTSLQVAGGTRNGRAQTTVSVNQLVYNFGRTPAHMRQAREEEQANIENLAGTRADVVLNVKQAYYTRLQNQHLVQVFVQNLAQQQAHVAATEAQEAAGVVPHTNVLTARAAAAAAQFDLVTARNAAEQARIDLSAAMGVDIRSDFEIREETEPSLGLPGESDAVCLAMSERPEVRRDVNRIEAAQAGERAAATGNLPSVVATASYSPNAGATGVGQTQSWALVLNLQWNFLDFGATSGAVQQARAQVEITRETLYADRQTVAAEAAQARLRVIAAEAQLAAAAVEVISARANQEAAMGSYQAGVGIFLSVIDAQAALLRAQVDELSARYGLSIARATLRHAVGGNIL